MQKLKVLTDNPVAYKSPDHILPTGTKNDNTTNTGYITEVENYFGGKKINVMDVGCAGGQLIVDFYKRGHNAIGIEGSDYNVKHQLHNWPEYHKNVLWTADATKPFSVINDAKEETLFDLISAWEVVEHIHREKLETFLDNLLSHLSPGGMFVASVNASPDVRTDDNGKLVFLHQTVCPKEYWLQYLLKKYNVIAFPFENKVRNCNDSFFISIKKPSSEDYRKKLGLKDKVVFGMRQVCSDEKFSTIPLLAYKEIEQLNTAFFIMGGSKKYSELAKQLELKNFFQIQDSLDLAEITKFYNTIDIYAHGENEQVMKEIDVQRLYEALSFGKPIVSHYAGTNNHVGVINDAGVVHGNFHCYVYELVNLKDNVDYRLWRGKKALTLINNEHVKSLTPMIMSNDSWLNDWML